MTSRPVEAASNPKGWPRPRGSRGYPIPYVVGPVTGGNDDLGVLDHGRSIECLNEFLCVVCGAPISTPTCWVAVNEKDLISDDNGLCCRRCARLGMARWSHLNGERAADPNHDGWMEDGARLRLVEVHTDVIKAPLQSDTLPLPLPHGAPVSGAGFPAPPPRKRAS